MKTIAAAPRTSRFTRAAYNNNLHKSSGEKNMKKALVLASVSLDSFPSLRRCLSNTRAVRQRKPAAGPSCQRHSRNLSEETPQQTSARRSPQPFLQRQGPRLLALVGSSEVEVERRRHRLNRPAPATVPRAGRSRSTQAVGQENGIFSLLRPDRCSACSGRRDLLEGIRVRGKAYFR